jgi:nucleoside-diphosphate-sugar epimerase
MSDALLNLSLQIKLRQILMSIFITGTTGYVGKHLLRYFVLAGIPVTICIRSKKGVSAKDRLLTEIVRHPLFLNVPFYIRIVEKDVSQLIESDLAGCHTIIHCAANVKFTSSLELLMQENVQAVQHLHKISKGLRFVHISTCYVHPKNSTYEPVAIPKGLQRSDFICDYAYTKYLAEEYLYSQGGNIDIIRLSCVGAPIENLPPIRAGAHMSIMEAVLRSAIPDIWFPVGFKFSAVPVDIVAKEIIKHISTPWSGLQIRQYAGPENSRTYNLDLNDLAKELGSMTKIWTGLTFAEFKEKMISKYWMFPSIAKTICHHNEAISYISQNIVFKSSIQIPEIGNDTYMNMTVNYVRLFTLTNPTKLTVQKFFQNLIPYIA